MLLMQTCKTGIIDQTNCLRLPTVLPIFDLDSLDISP